MGTASDNTASRKTNGKRLTVNRRATFMLGMGGLVSAAAPTVASASQLANLKAVGLQGQIIAIRRNGNAFEVKTADGRNSVFQESNLRFKVDSSDLGPLVGKPVVLPGGRRGDRATIFFASAAEIAALDR
jgi:hypothetical protein